MSTPKKTNRRITRRGKSKSTIYKRGYQRGKRVGTPKPSGKWFW